MQPIIGQTTLAELEKHFILETVELLKPSHKQAEIALILGITPRTLRMKLRDYGVRPFERKRRINKPRR